MSQGPAYVIVEPLEVKDAAGISEYASAIIEQMRSRGVGCSREGSTWWRAPRKDRRA
jgi:hypothetical protein